MKANKNQLVGVVIGASSDAIHAIEVARKHGIYVYALDGNANAAGMPYADEAITVAIPDTEAVSEVIDEIKPDFIIPVPIGRHLAVTGYINERYNLKGIKDLPTRLSTDKYEFHKSLYNQGLRSIQCYLLKSHEEKSNQQYEIKFPAILKPRYGSGSRDVFYCSNEVELREARTRIQDIDEEFILEQAVEGTEYGVDGAVIDGKFIITLLREKMITPLPIRQAISSFSVVDNEVNNKLLQRAYEKVSKVVKVLSYDNCLINADIIINDNDVFVIEISPRPSGHNLHNVFVPESTEIDIVEEYIKFLKGEEFNFSPKTVKQLQIRFFDFEDRIISHIPGESDLRNCGKCNLRLWQCNIREGEYMNKVKNGHSIMNRGFFIVEGDSKKDLIHQSEWILEQFK